LSSGRAAIFLAFLIGFFVRLVSRFFALTRSNAKPARADDKAVAVVLDFVDPVELRGRLGGAGRDAGAIWAGRNHGALPYRLVTPAWNCHSVAELVRYRRRSMVKRERPSPKAKKMIVKHMVRMPGIADRCSD
jgi:hypothetical protein